MTRPHALPHTRRDFLWTGLLSPALGIFAAAQRTAWPALQEALAGNTSLLPTPSCGEAESPTPKQTEGPYYKRLSPERRTLLEPGIAGIPLLLSGLVLTRRCQPVALALLDFWQADARGAYDNKGYRLRGHQFTDEAGRYRLETIVPGLYPGRTRHIHVKVQAADYPVLISQLYFPGEPRNETDRLFNPALLLMLEDTAARRMARFNFVLDIA